MGKVAKMWNKREQKTSKDFKPFVILQPILILVNPQLVSALLPFQAHPVISWLVLKLPVVVVPFAVGNMVSAALASCSCCFGHKLIYLQQVDLEFIGKQTHLIWAANRTKKCSPNSRVFPGFFTRNCHFGQRNR